MRRGRPTVWKKWDIKHAINSGDAQLILAHQELMHGADNYKDAVEPLIPFVNDTFLRVAEGQFLDFTLADLSINDPFVTVENYLKMIGRKSAVLVGASAKLAGLVAGKSKEECDALWDYGYNLGMAYQLNDDLLSIWGTAEETGKIVEGKLEKFYQTYCLVDQGFVKKNSEISVKEHVASVAKQLGDEVTIRRFVRFQIGEATAA